MCHLKVTSPHTKTPKARGLCETFILLFVGALFPFPASASDFELKSSFFLIVINEELIMFGRWTRHRVRVLAALLIVASLYFFFANTSNHDSKRTTFQDTPNLRRPPFPPPPPSPPKSAPDNTQAKSKPKDIETAKFGDNDVEIVIASMKKENVTWLHDYLPDWKKNIYVVDDPGAELSVPTNKGREAMVFLTWV